MNEEGRFNLSSRSICWRGSPPARVAPAPDPACPVGGMFRARARAPSPSPSPPCPLSALIPRLIHPCPPPPPAIRSREIVRSRFPRIAGLVVPSAGFSNICGVYRRQGGRRKIAAILPRITRRDAGDQKFRGQMRRDAAATTARTTLGVLRQPVGALGACGR
jgi:hypothetical protein